MDVPTLTLVGRFLAALGIRPRTWAQLWGRSGWQAENLTRLRAAVLANVSNNLRQKIEQDPAHPARIVTVHGVGYRFTAEP